MKLKLKILSSHVSQFLISALCCWGYGVFCDTVDVNAATAGPEDTLAASKTADC